MDFSHFCSQVSCEFEILKDELILKGVDFHKIAYIPNCVEESQIINRTTKNNTNIITTIGNLRENKNHEFFH